MMAKSRSETILNFSENYLIWSYLGVTLSTCNIRKLLLPLGAFNLTNTAQKMLAEDLFTFTGEILDGKLHFLCSENLDFSVVMLTDLIKYATNDSEKLAGLVCALSQ